MQIPIQLKNKTNMLIFKHKEETGHTKFTILGQGGKKKKHQANWQAIKCKECDVTLGS